MNKEIIKSEIIVKDCKIGVLRIENKEYISLTDLARYADNEEPRLPIRDWMWSKEVISYLGLWESLHNENFKVANSIRLKMKQEVTHLRCHLING